jgi:membrane peptidoglycan carboxypeptidase
MAKTGTTDNAKDTWVVGGTTATTSAVWVGNVQGGANLRNVYGFPGCGGQAAQARHCIWQEITSANEAVYPGAPAWPSPDAQYLYGQQIPVPTVSGMTLGAAKRALQKLGFRAEVGAPITSDVAKDLAAGTNPQAGAQAPAGSTVTILPSSGPAAPQQQPQQGQGTGDQTGGVPNVVGLTGSQASDQISAAGYVPEIVYLRNGTDCTVKYQSPEQHSNAAPNTSVKAFIPGFKNACHG